MALSPSRRIVPRLHLVQPGVGLLIVKTTISSSGIYIPLRSGLYLLSLSAAILEITCLRSALYSYF